MDNPVIGWVPASAGGGQLSREMLGDRPMTNTTKQRVYGKLREIIERHGGTMVYERDGFTIGAWILSLDGKEFVIESTGNKSHPDLDKLYVPKVTSPQTWEDYRDELLEDAEKRLLANFV